MDNNKKSAGGFGKCWTFAIFFVTNRINFRNKIWHTIYSWGGLMRLAINEYQETIDPHRTCDSGSGLILSNEKERRSDLIMMSFSDRGWKGACGPHLGEFVGVIPDGGLQQGGPRHPRGHAVHPNPVPRPPLARRRHTSGMRSQSEQALLRDPMQTQRGVHRK